MKLRMATVNDTAEILDVYAQYIDTAITFEYVLPTEEEFAARIESVLAEYPYIVCENEGKILGYAYAHRDRERAAYQWNAEMSIYIAKDNRHSGIGSRLYSALQALLICMGIYNAYACITLPNEASCSFHEKMGYEKIGIRHNSGFKNDVWHDSIWYEKRLTTDGSAPLPFDKIGTLPAEIVENILAVYSDAE